MPDFEVRDVVKFVKSISMQAAMTDRLRACRVAYIERMGVEPNGFIMGPLEYISFVEEIRPLLVEKGFDTESKEAVFYCGVPVFVKETPGVECIVHYCFAANFAIGAVKPLGG